MSSPSMLLQASIAEEELLFPLHLQHCLQEKGKEMLPLQEKRFNHIHVCGLGLGGGEGAGRGEANVPRGHSSSVFGRFIIPLTEQMMGWWGTPCLMLLHPLMDSLPYPMR